MPTLPTREVKQFLDALEAFGQKPPGDLPDGALDKARELGQLLRGYVGPENANASPGEREALKQAQGSDTAVHFSKAAVGVDGPSPGQREYAQVAKQAQELADSISSL